LNGGLEGEEEKGELRDFDFAFEELFEELKVQGFQEEARCSFGEENGQDGLELSAKIDCYLALLDAFFSCSREPGLITCEER